MLYAKNEYKYSDITGRIIKCAMNVHNQLGSGFQEFIYQRALAIEMIKEGLEFIREYDMKVYYDNQEIGTRRVDFFVEGVVIIELKAIADDISDLNKAQIINYLEICRIDVGLLINFGNKSLKFKRFINEKNNQRKISVISGSDNN